MSYDVSVWCAQPFDDPALLPSGEKWIVGEEQWSYECGTWLINTGPSARVLEEDVPHEILGTVPGIAYLTEISLEPITAPKVGLAMLRRVARTVAKVSHGVVFDPQEDSVELAGGVKRFSPPRRDNEDRFALLTMSWWFDHDRVLEADWIDSFLTLLETHLPEALPKRYGLWEPPQHVYVETGRNHLAAFLHDHLDEIVVWYANRPAVDCSLSARPTRGWCKSPNGPTWRCNRVSVSVEATALAQPGWPIALRRFWRQMSLQVDPFFGEVRTLYGYTGRPPRVAIDAATDVNPTRASFWKGIPSKLGHAVVVGAPYKDVWPALESVAQSDNSLLFFSTDDWSDSQDVTELVGDVPAEIALPFLPFLRNNSYMPVYPDTYPEFFPFGELPQGAKRWDGELPPEIRTRRSVWRRFWLRTSGSRD